MLTNYDHFFSTIEFMNNFFLHNKNSPWFKFSMIEPSGKLIIWKLNLGRKNLCFISEEFFFYTDASCGSTWTSNMATLRIIRAHKNAFSEFLKSQSSTAFQLANNVVYFKSPGNPGHFQFETANINTAICFSPSESSRFGTIQHFDYGPNEVVTFSIQSSCEFIEIYSTKFETGSLDALMIRKRVTIVENK